MTTQAPDIKTEWRAITDPVALVAHSWATSHKNSAARHYQTGLVDALLWARALTPEQAETAYRVINEVTP